MNRPRIIFRTIKPISVALLSLIMFLASSIAAAQAQVSVSLAPMITGLSEPVDMAHAGDGSGRLFIVERAGRIRVWDGTTLLAAPFLDISALTTTESERGLLGLAFHPQYASNGRFFVHYTDLSGATVLAAYRADPAADQADGASSAILLQVPQPFANHNGGQIRFGPDSFLYIAIGDGGSGGDPQNNAQNLDSLLGKLLRIDVDSASPYTIPADNPFVGQTNRRPEIWAVGLRNPWRFSFDRLTGDIFIGDVGQGQFEEINLQPASSNGGENYGWRLMEGLSCFNPPSACNAAGELALPILTYDHSTGFSVTGGFVYRGLRFPLLAGRYVFGDFVTGEIFLAESQTGGPWEIIASMDTALNISTFGEDENAELYLAHYNTVDGAIYRIASVNEVLPPMPATAPSAATTASGGNSGGGCFIAAAGK